MEDTTKTDEQTLQAEPKVVEQAKVIEFDEHKATFNKTVRQLGIDAEEDIQKLLTVGRPIFIATIERELGVAIKGFLEVHPSFREKNYEILMLGKDVFEGFYSNFLLGKLEAATQERVRQIQSNAHYGDRYMAQALQLEYLLAKYFAPGEKINFTESELRSLMRKEGKVLSHSAVWEIIDMFTLFNLLIPTPETLNEKKHKQRYVLTLNTQYQIDYYSILQDSVESSIMNNKSQLKTIDAKLKELQKQLKKENAIANKQAKRVKPKKQTESVPKPDDGANSNEE